MDLNVGKDGAVTAVDGRLFHTGMHRPKKQSSRRHQQKRVKGCMLWDTACSSSENTMLWFNFILVLNSIFLCFWGMVMYDNEFETKEKKFKQGIKLNHNKYTKVLMKPVTFDRAVT